MGLRNLYLLSGFVMKSLGVLKGKNSNLLNSRFALPTTFIQQMTMWFSTYKPLYFEQFNNKNLAQ